MRLFSENFEGLTNDLRSYRSATEVVDADPTDWTPNAPSGWSINNRTTPVGNVAAGAGGPEEFYGWTFHDKSAWVQTAKDQSRSQFTKGQGVVAVADPDEYDDKDSGGSRGGIVQNGSYTSIVTTSAIDVSGLVDNKATLTFDSSWRSETFQEARVIVTFDTGAAVELLHWNSGNAGAGGVRKSDAPNETVTLTIDVPEGATKATVGFDMVKAGNNWWWAIDNVVVDAVRPLETQGNPFAGISDTTTWNFKTSSDTPLPQIVGVTPADDSGAVTTSAPLVVTFDEAVRAGEGSIVIHRADGSVVETISAGSDRVSIDGAVVTVQHAELDYGTGYYVTVDAGAFRDVDGANGNAFAGLDDAASWNFTTEADTYGPEVVGLAPADDATKVAPSDPLIVTFDEAVRKGTGSVQLHRADGSVVETIDVRSDAVSIDGNTVAIHPGTALAAGDYYVTVTADAFEDLALSTEKVLFSENFESLTPQLVSYTEVNDADDTDWTGTLPEGWARNNGTTPTGGPAEYLGWTFHDKEAWIVSAGNQGRTDFSRGQGVVAVADPDEYDDGRDIDGGQYKTLLRTPDFDVSGLQNNKATLTFDSSWLPEDEQEVRLVATFDNGAQVELLHWNSGSGGGQFKADAPNEAVTLTIDVPAGASNASLAFDMVRASNDWWWAIDNVAVTGNTPEPHGNAFAGISDPTKWNFSVDDPQGLSLRVSGDAYQGNAQFIVLVDGEQVGDIQTVTALHSDNRYQNITIAGDFLDAQSVTVQFLNDLYGGSPEADRNLYVDNIVLNGKVYEAEQATNNAGPSSATEAYLAVPGTLVFDTSPDDTLVLRVSQDAYQGDARFVVKADGVQVGGIQTVSSDISHAAQTYENITVQGHFADADNVVIEFLNDLYDGSPEADRNLYVDNITLNGKVYEAEQAVNNAGPSSATEAYLAVPGMLMFDMQLMA